LILTVPRQLPTITAPVAGVRVVEAPREIKSFHISWHGLRDSPMNLLTDGSVNNCTRLFGPSEQFDTDIIIGKRR
jgi:hypothetical protein